MKYFNMQIDAMVHGSSWNSGSLYPQNVGFGRKSCLICASKYIIINGEKLDFALFFFFFLNTVNELNFARDLILVSRKEKI